MRPRHFYKFSKYNMIFSHNHQFNHLIHRPKPVKCLTLQSNVQQFHASTDCCLSFWLCFINTVQSYNALFLFG